MSWGFEIGKTYHRKRDIHGQFKGQEQGGIITPSNFNLVVAITGDAGHAHGYTDKLRDDGVFEYFGEGQVGDMSFKAGNKAILEHTEAGKDLLLFRKVKGGVRYEGDYVCEGFQYRNAPGRDQVTRTAIVFELRPLEAIVEAIVPEGQSIEGDDNLEDLRKRAYAAAKTSPNKTIQPVGVFERARIVRDYVVARSRGSCEDCGEKAPFVTAGGQPFLEVHHITRLTDGGPDSPSHMIALCPNCHRAAHFAADKVDRNARMLGFVSAHERASR